MTHQALARKWRPRNFGELSGQGHVVRALTNALERGRLHHAYLLTGTRGVGKTTIARILAKSLNCAQGVTATPCGVCPACMDIDAGRFVDLLELDAASNTGIDNMREILDNARYAPTVGRYKVYLIDEVHMLSKQAFNSMLKTLEEPPEHVKFVLATTDPQKIPVTVLSRCLQFNLKQLPKALIAARLAEILQAEQIAFEAPALTLIAHSAKGSMRDALSVLDQAIAYGGGEVHEDVVRTMLGVVDGDHVYRIVDALLASDGPVLLHEASAVSERGLSATAALDDLASLLHRVAILQTVPAAAEGWPDASRLAAYAGTLSPEMVQLAYQIVVQGRADLALAPDEATGMTMTLLRLLAFEPTAGWTKEMAVAPAVTPRNGPTPDPVKPRKEPTPDPVVPRDEPTRDPILPREEPTPDPVLPREEPTPDPDLREEPTPDPDLPRDEPTRDPVAPAASASTAAVPVAPAARQPALIGAPIATSSLPSAPQPLPEPAQWPAFVAALKLSGIALQLAAQTELKSVQGNELVLHLPESGRHLLDKTYTDKLKAALEQALARRLRLRFEVTTEPVATLAIQEKEERARVQALTEATFHDDPFVQDVLARFDARIQPNSIKPV